MYQRVEKQEKFTEDALDCKAMKKEFEKSIKEDTTRKNEDSAKKLAVAQGMDYDGFHQMVLGANLKPVKKGEITSTKPQSRPFNSVATIRTGDSEVPVIEVKVEEEKNVEPRNQEEFDKYFNKRLVDVADKYRYMKTYALEKFQKLFKGEVDCELFVKMVKVMNMVVKKEVTGIETSLSDLQFICRFLHNLATSPKFPFMYKFMTEGEKREVRDLLSELDSALQTEMQQERDSIRALINN